MTCPFLKTMLDLQNCSTMMRSRAKTSILAPRSVKEVNNVLTGEAFSCFHSTVVGLEHNLNDKTHLTTEDTPFDEKTWGVTAADDDSMPNSIKTAMMSACLCVPAIKDLATTHHDQRFFERFFINRMCDDDAADQERLSSQAQHGWHADGDPERPFLTAVFTSCNGESDSDSVSSFQVGGAVGMSNADDGRFRAPAKASQKFRLRRRLLLVSRRPTVSASFLVILLHIASSRSNLAPFVILLSCLCI
jgi:hypothetical protein